MVYLNNKCYACQKNNNNECYIYTYIYIYIYLLEIDGVF
jgi:hypothetical protein